MADTTPVYDLPFLELGDPPDLAAGTEDLATAVEAELIRIDADVAAGQFFVTTYSGTTDANGFVTITHGAGFTPVAGWAVTTNPNSSNAQFWGIDTIGATTLRLRFANVAGGGMVSAAVQGRLFLLRP